MVIRLVALSDLLLPQLSEPLAVDLDAAGAGLGQGVVLEHPAHVVEEPRHRQHHIGRALFLPVIQKVPGIFVPLLRRPGQPLSGPLLIPGYFLSCKVQLAQQVLGIGIVLLGRLGEPLHRARRILNSDKGLYYYCCRDGSISNTLCERSVDELLQARLQLYTSLLRERGLDEKDLDEMYLHLCDPQILRLQLGGSLCIPERKVPLRRAVFTRRPWNYRLKAILKALSGTHYCRIVAQTRKVFHS